ncbi:probable uridine nucleosidase 2 isoform X2 [Lingula anatina]|uniref:Probable uridine nucleosidase 2 isoform X2 n=1 Tax=Lingula anatina TaxID=7574 RepID=A0A1S3JTG0_LINAN|nr:probable uridine nucleosidase 2 isoform X2 [Lingula anatina]|eukprot:XP_013413354.1 probable uridine nucleosidase 2 isoform X2 [Lingula anatina]
MCEGRQLLCHLSGIFRFSSRSSYSSMSGSGKKRLFVIDTDAGLDDAQAIMMALAQPDINIIGITTVNGNTTVNNVSKNVLRLLKTCRRLDIPVYQGCDGPLMPHLDPVDAGHYHGVDGFGDVPDPDPVDPKMIKPEHSALALVRLANEHPGEINLVAIGPLTNIALALRLDSGFGSKLKHCFIMGGNTEGKGNIKICAEFNFCADPEAASIVLNLLGCPVTVAGWELCLKCGFTWEWYKRLISKGTAKSELMRVLEANTIVKFYKEGSSEFYITADQIIMSVAIDPKTVKAHEEVYATVALNDPLTRGMMVIDWSEHLQKKPNVKVVTEVDHDLYGKYLQDALN